MPYAERRPSGSYRAVWYLPDGTKDREGGFISRSKAEDYAREREQDLRIGLDPASGNLPWSDWKAIWLRDRIVEASTLESDLPRIKKWVEPEWATIPINRIRRPMIQAWVNRLVKQDVSPGSLAKIFNLLSGSLTAAVEAEILPHNPCKGVKLPKPPPTGGQAYTQDEIEQILYYLNEPYKTAVLLMVYLGLRFGELAGLHWDQVDLDARRLDISQTWVPVDSTIKAYPKDGDFRTVRIPKRVAPILERPDDWRESCGLMHVDGKACRSRLVIIGPHGAPLNAKNMRRRHWLPALAAAGLSHGRQHDLRHTFATWLADGGVSMDDIAILLGHSSATVTKRYRHRAPTYGDAALAVLDGKGAPDLTPSLTPSRRLRAVPDGL
jgi:integrase